MIDPNFCVRHIPSNHKLRELEDFDDMQRCIQYYLADINQLCGNFELIEQDLARPTPCYARALTIIENVGENLKFVLGNEPDDQVMRKRIEETINMDSLRKQMKGKPFNFEESISLISQITDIIEEIVGAGRVIETREMHAELLIEIQNATDKDAQIHAFTKGLEFIADRARAINTDDTNVRCSFPPALYMCIQTLNLSFAAFNQAQTLKRTPPHLMRGECAEKIPERPRQQSIHSQMPPRPHLPSGARLCGEESRLPRNPHHAN